MTSTAALRRTALGLVRDLRPEALSGEEAAVVVRDLAVVEKAVATGRMFAAVRVAKTEAWRGEGHLSAADWLAAQVGITVREAQVQLGTARKAAGMPKTREAMAEGELSPVQAAAVTDAVSVDPEVEEELLRSAAEETTAALKERAAKARAAATDAASRERRIRAERSLRMRTDADGAFNLHLRGPAVDGVRLVDLLRPFEEQAFRTGRSDGVRDRYENRAYDAFQALLASIRSGVAAPSSSTSASPRSSPPASPTSSAPVDPAGPPSGSAVHGSRRSASGGAGTVPDEGRAADAVVSVPGSVVAAPGAAVSASGSRSSAGPPVGGNNIKAIVLVSHTALVRGYSVAGETCEVAGLGPISVEAARELMADAFLAAVVTKGRDVVNVAHLGRALSAHQRTAIEAMGLRCSNIACNHRIALQIDHRTPWADRAETKLDNQDPLCPACHRLKTHRGYQLDPGIGPRRFRPPDRSADRPSVGTSDRGDDGRPVLPPDRQPPISAGANPGPVEGHAPPGEISQPTLC